MFFKERKFLLSTNRESLFREIYQNVSNAKVSSRELQKFRGLAEPLKFLPAKVSSFKVQIFLSPISVFSVVYFKSRNDKWMNRWTKKRPNEPTNKWRNEWMNEWMTISFNPLITECSLILGLASFLSRRTK